MATIADLIVQHLRTPNAEGALMVTDKEGYVWRYSGVGPGGIILESRNKLMTMTVSYDSDYWNYYTDTDSDPYKGFKDECVCSSWDLHVFGCKCGYFQREMARKQKRINEEDGA